MALGSLLTPLSNNDPGLTYVVFTLPLHDTKLYFHNHASPSIKQQNRRWRAFK